MQRHHHFRVRLLLLPSLAMAQAKEPVKLKVGMVAAIDMLALPIAWSAASSRSRVST